MPHDDMNQPSLFDDDNPETRDEARSADPAAGTPVAVPDTGSTTTPPLPPATAAASFVPPIEVVWAQEVWDAAGVPVLPGLLVRTDGQGLLYPGKSHTIAGEPGVGKSWLAKAAAAQLLAMGQTVFYIDFDATDTDVVAGLRSLGVSREQAHGRFAYLRADLSRLEEVVDQLMAQIEEFNPTLVVIDGLAAAMAAAGLDENSNRDATWWNRQVVTPLTDAGVTTLTVDHISKAAAANGAARTSYARRAGAKLADITGAAYLLTSRDGFDTTTPGLSLLSVLKDRFGQIGPRGHVVAHIHFLPHRPTEEVTEAGAPRGEPAGLEVRIDPAPSGEMADTALQEEVLCRVAAEGPMNRTAVRKKVPGNYTRITEAINALVADGLLTVEKRGRTELLRAAT